MSTKLSTGVRILRMPDVINRTGLSRSTIYAFSRAGQFPGQVSLGCRAVGWVEDDVEEWLRSRPRQQASELQ